MERTNALSTVRCRSITISAKDTNGRSILLFAASLSRSKAATSPSCAAWKSWPRTDFYQFACGGWMKRNPIPEDQARWGRFNELDQNNRIILRQLLEAVSAPAAQKDANGQKIGDFYASCMDKSAIAGQGLKPLQPDSTGLPSSRTRRTCRLISRTCTSPGRTCSLISTPPPTPRMPA